MDKEKLKEAKSQLRRLSNAKAYSLPTTTDNVDYEFSLKSFPSVSHTITTINHSY